MVSYLYHYPESVVLIFKNMNIYESEDTSLFS